MQTLIYLVLISAFAATCAVFLFVYWLMADLEQGDDET